MESAAHALGFITNEEYIDRVLQTLQSITGNNPDFNMPRSKNGWIPRFPDSDTGRYNGSTFEMMPSGLLGVGVLYARKYTATNFDASDEKVIEIQKLATDFYHSIKYDTLLCDSNGTFDPNGVVVPMTTNTGDSQCNARMFLAADGFYNYNEEHYTVWLAHETSKENNGGTATAGYEKMWNAWNGRKEHPNQSYAGHDLLSRWASYIVHLPYYMMNVFNSDDDFKRLFKSHWEADRAYYSSNYLYAGERGRYGLAAGPTQ